MKKSFRFLLVLNKTNTTLLLLVLTILHIYPIKAQNVIEQDENSTTIIRSKAKKDDWIAFPRAIKVAPYLGGNKMIPQQIKPKDTQLYLNTLYIYGVNFDISVTQLREYICKHFDCYPKLGLKINIGRFQNKGYLLGGLAYIAPQRDYLAKWEIFPNLGVGISYASIPGTNFKKSDTENEDEDEDEDETTTPSEENFYHQGLHLDLWFALTIPVQLTPHWQINADIGFNYMPTIEQKKEEKQNKEDKSLKIVNTSIGVSYIPNPNIIRYPIGDNNKLSRINIGWLSAYNKPPAQQNEIDPNIYYYIGGIYAQWSLHVINSHAFTLATEWVYDITVKNLLKNQIRSSPWKISLLGGHEFRYGKIFFSQQLGCYLYDNAMNNFLLYARLGLDYKLTEFLFIGLNMKLVANKSKIKNILVLMDYLETEYIEFRISYAF